MTARRYRIRCGEETHTVELSEDGGLVFHDHAEAFRTMDLERVFAVLNGDSPTEGTGCLRLAYLVRSGKLTANVPVGDDLRRLLATLRGIKIGREVRQTSGIRTGSETRR